MARVTQPVVALPKAFYRMLPAQLFQVFHNGLVVFD
jgi:hypothetical protein